MNHQEDRIVVTGMGTVSAHGVDDQALWSSIRNGDLPPRHTHSNPSETPPVVRVDKFQAADILGKKGLQFMQPSSLFLCAASLAALSNASIDLNTVDPDQLGIVISTNYSGFKVSSQFDQTTITEGPKHISPMEVPNGLVNAPASHLAIRIQSRACNTTISSGFCAGLDAIGYGISMLRKKNADFVVVGGTDEWNDEVHWYYNHAGLLSAGPKGSLIPGEGAAVVVLERYEDAIRRKANILGEITSWYSCFAPVANQEARIKGFMRCMDTVIQNGTAPNHEVDLVITSTNGLVDQDHIELTAINEKFKQVPILDIKKTIGETSGAGGLFQVISSIHAIKDNAIPSHALVNGSSNETDSISTVLLTANDLFGGISSVLVKAVS
ncbi:beta-ketoacyl synthase N-terminal-like domain-containing protein [Paenibacillus sp. 481]|uniref:beta-ketoacyl synthase N-terminal-like domain-containing protein n=1 Tax=Paenibacillus sp. 481 TaxID=2835869 RepID=UPI001E48D71A|nr:beta-ketoacyl synthase N-terminal-like domain-containing protein [Paenibacillus sp. 481]UHA72036.1 hypothetical protein KIK04_15100 [Paenibacillus sp. 481]